MQKSQALRPLMKWAGGKKKLLKHYKNRLPDYQAIDSFVEPFFGGGALFCDIVASAPKNRRYVINDNNEELVSIYLAIRDDCEEFIAHLKPLEAGYLRCAKRERKKAFYYTIRTQYWGMQLGTVRTAATLYFLLLTSFNGIWQLCKESEGRFGTPAGRLIYRSVIDEARIRIWSTALQSATISATSFERVQVPAGSFVYCDPPYRGGHASYGKGFTDADQIRLIQWCDQLARKGCHVFLANRDLGDGFFDRYLPKYCLVSRVSVIYTAGRRKRTASGFEAKPATEILAEFPPRRRRRTSHYPSRSRSRECHRHGLRNSPR